MEKSSYKNKQTIIPKWLWILIIGVAFLIVLAFYKWAPNNRKSVLDLVGLLGSYITLVGFIIALLQIMALRSVSEATEYAVKETKHKVESISLVVDCSRVVELLRQTESSIRQDEISVALFLLQEAKDIMTRTQSQSLINDKEYTKFTKSINEMISQFNRFLIQPVSERSLNKDGMIDKLEAMVDYFNGVYNKGIKTI